MCLIQFGVREELQRFSTSSGGKCRVMVVRVVRGLRRPAAVERRGLERRRPGLRFGLASHQSLPMQVSQEVVHGTVAIAFFFGKLVVVLRCLGSVLERWIADCGACGCLEPSAASITRKALSKVSLLINPSMMRQEGGWCSTLQLFFADPKPLEGECGTHPLRGIC
jgi:hypothetical protein